MRALFAVTLTLTIPLVTHAAPRSYADLVSYLIGIINGIVGVLVLAALVIYLFALAFSLMGTDEHSKERSKTLFLWGIIILFVMVSLWSIAFLIRSTFFPDNVGQIVVMARGI